MIDSSFSNFLELSRTKILTTVQTRRLKENEEDKKRDNLTRTNAREKVTGPFLNNFLRENMISLDAFFKIFFNIFFNRDWWKGERKNI